ITGFSVVDERNAADAAMAFVSENRQFIGVLAQNLSVESVVWEKNRAFVYLNQKQGDTPVWGANLNLIITPDARVSFFRSDLVPGIGPVAIAFLDETSALDAAIDYIEPVVPPRRIDRLGLFIYPVWAGDSYSEYTVWAFGISTEEPLGYWLVTVDARDDKIISIANELRTVDIGGNIRGRYHPEFKDDPLEIGIWHYARIIINSVDYYADIDGDWSGSTAASPPWTYTTTHYGRYCDVDNDAGSDAAYSTDFSASPFDFTWGTSHSPDDEMNVYFHINKMHNYVRDTLGFTGMDYCIEAIVNNSVSPDNSYYDGRDVFFGGGESVFYDMGLFVDVVDHEYTHGVTHHIYPGTALPYSGESGALDEAFSDYFPCSMTDNPRMGDGGLYRSGAPYMRRCNTDKVYPDDIVDEVHADGEIISACWWRIRDSLGRFRTDSLIHLTRFTLANDFEDFFWATLATDDDDGDISNGTPNARLIYESYGIHGIGPGFDLKIEHHPHANTEQTTGDYDFNAIFHATLGVVDDSARLTWRVDSGSWVIVPMTYSFGAYRASIPAQPLGSVIDYYISGMDNGGYFMSSPTGAPSSYHTFSVYSDTTAPIISASPIGDWFEYAWPPTITATVTDDQGVEEVSICGRIGATMLTPVAMVETDTYDVWKGVLPGEPDGGDTLEYWLIAIDISAAHNTSTFPPTGTLKIYVLEGYNEDMEDPGNRGLHTYSIRSGYVDQWHRAGNNNPYSAGTYCFQFNDGSEYANKADGVLSTPELRIGDPATLTFWHYMSAEIDGDYAGYAWDGGIVEVSTDGGSTWLQVFPAPGYNYRIQNNPASPFSYNTQCYSGDIWWREETLDMTSFAPKAMVRFHFGSDAYVTGSGWFIDDIVLETDLHGIDSDYDKMPETIRLYGNYPNPFNAFTVIEFSLPVNVTDAKLQIFDLNGRIVRDIPVETDAKEFIWDGTDFAGRNLPSGIYLVRLLADGHSAMRKAILIK
ncbi:hypothetical protein DRQ36_04375, partial [bacterium]